MASSQDLLIAKNLSIGYGDDPLFHDLDLNLNARELICIMGPNGIGKTTLIRTLAGLQKPMKGIIDSSNSSVAVVLTDRINSYNMTVRDLISYGRYPYLSWNIDFKEVDKQIIEKSISQVRLEHLSEKNINELSDGQLQLALIARALAQDTSILLLDEPTAHLDLNNRIEIMTLLRQLAQTTHKAILVATHELDLALQTADKIWLATHDKKILKGIPEDLVLDGSFDKVFQFKGFDLKTGKLQHQAHRGVTIQLEGDGHGYLWTKNALERSGFEVNEKSELKIKVCSNDQIHWKYNGMQFESLAPLLEVLKAIDIRD